MHCSHIGLVIARSLSSPPLGAGDSVQAGGVWTTAGSQILVELAPADSLTANLFDLDRRSLAFRPDVDGRYSRAVRRLAREEPIGPLISDSDGIKLGFDFDLGGRSWTSFHISRHGLLTFGAPKCSDSSWGAGEIRVRVELPLLDGVADVWHQSQRLG